MTSRFRLHQDTSPGRGVLKTYLAHQQHHPSTAPSINSSLRFDKRQGAGHGWAGRHQQAGSLLWAAVGTGFSPVLRLQFWIGGHVDSKGAAGSDRINRRCQAHGLPQQVELAHRVQINRVDHLLTGQRLQCLAIGAHAASQCSYRDKRSQRNAFAHSTPINSQAEDRDPETALGLASEKDGSGPRQRWVRPQTRVGLACRIHSAFRILSPYCSRKSNKLRSLCSLLDRYPVSRCRRQPPTCLR